jgi:hypothetical protein
MREGRDNVDVAGSKRESRQIEFGFMSRVHDCTIGVADADRVAGETLIDDVCGDRTKMRRATAVGDGARIGRDDGGGT